MKKVLVSIIILLLFARIPAFSAEESDNEYTVFDKFSRGTYNFFTFLLEIPDSIHKCSAEHGPLVGFLYGLPLGLGRSVTRFIIGAVELTTFTFPPYEPIFEPDIIY